MNLGQFGFPIGALLPNRPICGMVQGIPTLRIKMPQARSFTAKLKLLNVLPDTNNASLRMRVSRCSGGPGDSTAGDYYYSIQSGYSAAAMLDQQGSNTFMMLLGEATSGVGSSPEMGLEAEFDIYNPGAVDKDAVFTWRANYKAGGSVLGSRGIGMRYNPQSVRYLEFYFSSGSIKRAIYNLTWERIAFT